MQAIEAAGYMPGGDVALALDCASSEFYERGKYRLAAEKLELSAKEFSDYLADACRPVPDREHRGRDGRVRLGRLAGPHADASASGCSSSATISS